MVTTEEAQDRVAASLQGDLEAFESLIREHQRMIYSVCFRMTGSAADAEDLTQEAFIHAYQRLADFRADCQFSSWLYRIAVNLCLNWRKRAARRLLLHEAFSRETGSGSEPSCGYADQVQAALLQLDPKQRAAVVMTCYEGLTHAEAARALGCSETTVSWRLFAARRKLKRLLGPSLNPEVGG